MYKIAIDVMGSDNGPEILTEGAVKALYKNPDLAVVIFGDAKVIEAKLSTLDYDRERVEIVDCADVITNYDHPVEAIFRKNESSLVKSLVALGTREDLVGMINAGSTGALLAGSLSGLLTGELLEQICTVGYAIIMAIGFNFIFKNKFKTLNMLPAIILPVVYHYILILVEYFKGII